MSRPPVAPASAASPSSGFIAAATHVASSRPANNGASALTTPPPPRLATRSPASSRSKWYGPRCEATITARSPQLVEHAQPVLELARRQELAAYALTPGLAHLVRAQRI